MKKNSFKSSFSELYLISPVVYKAVLENIKKSGGGNLQELEKLNKNFLADEGEPVLEQGADLPIQTEASNSIDTQTNSNPITNPSGSQTSPIVDDFSQATQTTQNQNMQMTQTPPNHEIFSKGVQTDQPNYVTHSVQTTPNEQKISKGVQTDQPNYVTNSAQTTPNVQNFSKEVQTTQPSYSTNTTQTTPDVQTATPPLPSLTSTPQLEKEKQQIANSNGLEVVNTSKKLYPCDYCDTKFTRLFSKQRHTKNIHGISKNQPTRKRKAEISVFPENKLKVRKTASQLKSQIPRPINGVIALAKNKNAVKKPVFQGKSKIPRLIKRKIFKDETLPKNLNTKVRKKRNVEPTNSGISEQKKETNRGLKRKKTDDLKKSTKKRKTFENW